MGYEYQPLKKGSKKSRRGGSTLNEILQKFGNKNNLLILAVVVVFSGLLLTINSATGAVLEGEVLKDQLETELNLTKDLAAECNSDLVQSLQVVDECSSNLATANSELASAQSQSEFATTEYEAATAALGSCQADQEALSLSIDNLKSDVAECNAGKVELQTGFDNLATNVARSFCCFGRTGTQNWEVTDNQITCGSGERTIEC